MKDEYLILHEKALKETYLKSLNEIVNMLNTEQLIAIIGNGGSCSTAEHFACDLNNIGYKAIALTNSSVLTANSNDYGYEHSFDRQIKILNPDMLIAISASGKSQNIINAVKVANTVDCDCGTISFTGFDGGELKKITDVNIHVPINNYEIVEDIHLMISHMIKCRLKNKK